MIEAYLAPALGVSPEQIATDPEWIATMADWRAEGGLLADLPGRVAAYRQVAFGVVTAQMPAGWLIEPSVEQAVVF